MAHESRIACFKLARDGGIVATASSKGTLVRVWDTRDGSLLQEVYFDIAIFVLFLYHSKKSVLFR